MRPLSVYCLSCFPFSRRSVMECFLLPLISSGFSYRPETMPVTEEPAAEFGGLRRCGERPLRAPYLDERTHRGSGC